VKKTYQMGCGRVLGLVWQGNPGEVQMVLGVAPQRGKRGPRMRRASRGVPAEAKPCGGPLGEKSGDRWGGGIGSRGATGSRGCGVGGTVTDGWGGKMQRLRLRHDR
jgi:hypothetical protein